MNEEHLKEFFTLLDEQYDHWQRLRGWHGSRLINKPYYFLTHEITSTIFKYEGYEKTDAVRDKSQKNEIIKKMLAESLESKATIFDCGTYDGKRLKNILDELPQTAKDNILGIFGIDSNKRKLVDADKLFSDTDYRFIPINSNIQDVNFNMYRTERRNQPKNIILGLENVFLNFNGLSFQHNKGLTGFLSSMTLPNDEIILELHNVNNKEAYPEEVESFFYNYIKDSGLEQILGGKIISEYDEYGKSVYLTEIKPSVDFNGKKYTFNAHTINNPKKGLVSAEPRIYIGFSGAIPYEKIFEFLVFNFANNLYIPKKEDIEFIGTDMSLKLRNFEHDKWIIEAKEKSESFEYRTYSGIKKTCNSGLTEYITLKELYPHQYNRFVYKNSNIIGVDTDTMESFAHTHNYGQKKYPPITTAFPQTSFEKLQFS